MSSLTIRRCDLSTCARELPGRVVELRMVAHVEEAFGSQRDHELRAEVCSPACALTAARAVIERAFTSPQERS